MELVNPAKINRVLDIATGSGDSIKSIREMFKNNDIQITGIDISENNIVKARKSKSDKNTVFTVMNSAHLEFMDSSFEAVTMINSLHHFDDLTRSLTEAFRVLKRNGIMIICEMFCDTQNKRQQSHIKLHHWWAKIDNRLDIPHYKTFSRKHILSVLSGLPFREIEYNIEDNLDFPVTDDMMDKIYGYIDTYKQKALPLDNCENLQREGDDIRDYMHKYGSDLHRR